MSQEGKGPVSDILGIAPYGEALKVISEQSFTRILNLLSKVCSPAAAELGLMAKDQIRVWRLNNILKILDKYAGIVGFDGDNLNLNHRTVMALFEGGSLQEDDSIQDMWAGLLASFNQKDGDGTIIYVRLLDTITSTQAKIIEHYCTESEKAVNEQGVLETRLGIIMKAQEFFDIVGTDSIDRLHAEINHLISLNIVEKGMGLASGFFNKVLEGESEETLMIGLKVSPLALILYAKCRGHIGPVKDFYGVKHNPHIKVGVR